MKYEGNKIEKEIFIKSSGFEKVIGWRKDDFLDFFIFLINILF